MRNDTLKLLIFRAAGVPTTSTFTSSGSPYPAERNPTDETQFFDLPYSIWMWLLRPTVHISVLVSMGTAFPEIVFFVTMPLNVRENSSAEGSRSLRTTTNEPPVCMEKRFFSIVCDGIA